MKGIPGCKTVYTVFYDESQPRSDPELFLNLVLISNRRAKSALGKGFLGAFHSTKISSLNLPNGMEICTGRTDLVQFPLG